jgi:hypothetical protein
MFVVFPLFLLAILMTSGCTNTTSSGKGVSSLAFEPDHTEIYPGESVTFRAHMKNQGYVETTGAHAELLGLDEDWCGAIGTTDCRLSGGNRLEKLPNEPQCRYYSPGIGFSLLPASREIANSGGEQVCSWTYKAPPLSAGFEMKYTPILRVFYPYKTAVTKLITFASSDELRRIRDSGGSLPAETTGDTEGPVRISIETKGPIRFLENSVIFPLEIKITNAASGAPCSIGWQSVAESKDACKGGISGEGAKNKVTLKVTLDDQTDFVDDECMGFNSGEVIPLMKGQNTFVCDVQASGLDPVASVQKNIVVEAFYEYFFDVESSIRLIGRRTQ